MLTHQVCVHCLYQDNRQGNERDRNRKKIRELSNQVTLLDSQLNTSNKQLRKTEGAVKKLEEDKRKLLCKLSKFSDVTVIDYDVPL